MSDTSTTCRCGRPTRDDRYCCEDCADRLSRALGDVAWLETELETTITRAKGVDYRTKGGTRATERPSPVVWSASEAKTHLRAVMVSWVLFSAAESVRNQSPSQAIPEDTLVAMSRYLLWRVDGLTLLDIGPEAVEEITDAVAQCERVIDSPAERMYAGRCNAEGLDVTCPTELYVKVGAKTLKCPTCATVWDVAERREWLLLEAEEHLATAAEISRAVSWLGEQPLTQERVRKWAQRKRIIIKGHDADGRPLYRVGDAIDLLSGAAKKKGAAA